MHQMDDFPSLELLRCFAELHRERHLTRAARRVRLSQPAMSRALGRLREVFGDELFVRTPRGMLPTSRADAIAPQIEAVLAAASALVQPVALDPSRLARQFTIAMADMYEAYLVPPLAEALAKASPSVSLVTRPVNDQTPDALVAGRIDLLIGVAAVLPADTMRTKLFDDDFVCVVRADHPEVGKRLSLEKYCELSHVQIAPRGEAGGAVDTMLAARGLARRVVVRTHGFLSAPAIVASSDLVLTGPSRVLRPFAGRFGLRLLDPPLQLPGFSTWLGWHPRVHADPAHAWFRGQVAAAAGAHFSTSRKHRSRATQVV